MCLCGAGCLSPAAPSFLGAVEFCSKVLKFSLIPLILVPTPSSRRKSQLLEGDWQRDFTHEVFLFLVLLFDFILTPQVTPLIFPFINPASTDTRQLLGARPPVLLCLHLPTCEHEWAASFRLIEVSPTRSATLFACLSACPSISL